MQISIEWLCNAIKMGLKQEPKDSMNKIRVIDIKLLNNSTLVCEFYPYSEETIEIKIEIASIISFMASVFRGENYGHQTIKNFAAKAYSKNDEEIMYAISSKESADYLSEGNSIEWIKGTIFQDNSKEYRLHFAKSKISELENALRQLISNTLAKHEGEQWWNTCVDIAIRDSVSERSPVGKFSGKELIDYTYLVDLQKIISDNWSYFSCIFDSKTKLKKTIGSLNKIRIDEAHNRVITSDSIKKLEKIYFDMMGKIANLYPELASTYLIDNWRIQIRDIVNNYVANKVEIESGCELSQAIELTKMMIQQLQDVEIQLTSIQVPFTKESLHQELLYLFNVMRNLFEEMVKNAEDGDIENVEKNSQQIEENNVKIRKFTEKYIFSES